MSFKFFALRKEGHHACLVENYQLQCESKNNEHFDLTLTFNCAMTNQIRHQKLQATKLIAVTACSFFILHLIGFFLATQKHSRNNSSVHGFWIHTVFSPASLSS